MTMTSTTLSLSTIQSVEEATSIVAFRREAQLQSKLILLDTVTLIESIELLLVNNNNIISQQELNNKLNQLKQIWYNQSSKSKIIYDDNNYMKQNKTKLQLYVKQLVQQTHDILGF